MESLLPNSAENICKIYSSLLTHSTDLWVGRGMGLLRKFALPKQREIQEARESYLSRSHGREEVSGL